MPAGKVYLIGAGPGDVKLLTLKAVAALKESDVILIDDLVNPDIVQFAKPSTPVIHVGKRVGQKSTPQPFISKLMVSLAREGKCVARVKGGDPLIFARSGEEIAGLRQEGIDVQIINGITAALAASSALGLALSHRDFAHSITFVTGRSREGAQPNWQALAQSGSTLVIYMGVRTLPSIIERLIQGGLSPHTPAAAVENASLPDERHLITSLAQLPSAMRQNGMGSPAVIIIGKVVELSNALTLSRVVVSQSGRLP